MSDELDKLLVPLKYVDNDTLVSLAKKLKKSRNKQEQDVGKFLGRVALFKEEYSSTPEERNRFARNHGLRDLSE